MLLVAASCFAWADADPTLCIQTTTGEVQIPIATIRSIRFDHTTGTTMYVDTQSTATYQVSGIVKMTLLNVPEFTALEEISIEDAKDAQKVLLNGIIYIIKDGRVYTLRGEVVQ